MKDNKDESPQARASMFELLYAQKWTSDGLCHERRLYPVLPMTGHIIEVQKDEYAVALYYNSPEAGNGSFYGSKLRYVDKHCRVGELVELGLMLTKDEFTRMDGGTVFEGDGALGHALGLVELLRSKLSDVELVKISRSF